MLASYFERYSCDGKAYELNVQSSYPPCAVTYRICVANCSNLKTEQRLFIAVLKLQRVMMLSAKYV